MRNPGDLRSPGGRIARGQVDRSDRHPAFGRLGEAQEQRGDGALAAAARADERDRLPGRELEIDGIEHDAAPGGIGERDSFEPDRRRARARWRRTARACALGHVDELQEPLGDGETVRARVELGGEVAQRQVELRGEHEDRQPRFEADAAR